MKRAKKGETRCKACDRVASKRVRRPVLFADGQLKAAMVCKACSRRAAGIVAATSEVRPKRPPVDGREQLEKLRGQCKAFAQAARDACDGSHAQARALEGESKPRLEHLKHAAFHDGRTAAFESIASVIDGILVEWRIV